MTRTVCTVTSFCLAALALVNPVAWSEERAAIEPSRANQPAPGVSLPAAKVVRTAASGNWSHAATWEGQQLPAAGNQVVIREGHQVVYDVASEAILRSLHVSGTLSFATDQDTLLNVGLIRVEPGEKVTDEGFECDHKPDEKQSLAAATDASQPGFSAICVCCQSKAALLVGTPETPVAAGRSAKIRLHYVEGMNRESCPAIVVCGGRLDLHGQPLSRTWVKLGATASPVKNQGVTEITLAEPVAGWNVGDRLIVTSSDSPIYKTTGTEETAIEAIDGTRLTLATPLMGTHLGEGDYRSEVANLTRNIVVESADPDGVRGHVMVHNGSAGSLSYAELRHLGKEGVLGRYMLHFHLCGDSTRGSSLVGLSLHDSHNRFLTVHGTNYLVVRDCVGYQSLGHGFFLEDGTEVYNVFDRNLACQAAIGKPLPKQILPFDKNDGAGFWFANAHNTFTRNVGVECGQYGFRFDASPKAGAIVAGQIFGEPKREFNLALPIRQPDGSRREVDVRTLPFVRFEDNEAHSNGKWGLNLGQHSGGQVGPDPATPFVIRNMKIWAVIGGWGVEVPNVLIDGMTIHQTSYGVRESQYVAQDYRRVAFSKIRSHINVASLEEYLQAGSASEGHNRTRLPGWPQGKGDGGARFQPAEIEVARLNPVDRLPPQTVITSIRRESSGQLLLRGTTSDDGPVTAVAVNGRPVRATIENFREWEILLPAPTEGTLDVSAGATDGAGNKEITPHRMTIAL